MIFRYRPKKTGLSWAFLFPSCDGAMGRIPVLCQSASKNLHGDIGAGLRVGESVMMAGEVVAAQGGNGLQLMVGGMGENPAGYSQRIVKHVAGIVHLIAPHHSLQASRIERGIVGHKRQSLNERRNAGPYIRKERSAVGVAMVKAVNALAEPTVIVGLRLNKGLKTLGDLTLANYDHPHTAHAGAGAIGGLKVYGCKVFH